MGTGLWHVARPGYVRLPGRRRLAFSRLDGALWTVMMATLLRVVLAKLGIMG